LFDAVRVAHVEGPVGIVLASRRDDLVADLVLALGCRVLPDGRVVLVVSRSAGASVLACLDEGHGLAATFSMPSTHHTLQLKAPRASWSAATHADREAVARYRRLFARELASVGFGAEYSNALLAAREDDLVAVTFLPDAAFEQTPGPRAGATIVQEPGKERS
jgi:hypothetical protein